MSILDQFNLYAEYNRLMNRRLFAAAGQLSREQLLSDRGAFFKSVLGTLNHVLVGDIIWLQRFGSPPASAAALGYVTRLDPPQSLDSLLYDNLEDLGTERDKIDDIIVRWIDTLAEPDLDDSLSYRNMAGIPQCKPAASLISHLFLHQVHHRGQATTLISQFGVDFGDSDLLEMIDESSNLSA